MTRSDRTSADIVEPWLGLWNGALDTVEDIVAPDFVLHAAVVGGEADAVRGPHGLRDWIAGIRSGIPDLRFTEEVPPLVDGDRVAIRWHAVGHHGGGFPGAAAPAGTPIDFTGIDLLRLHDGQVAEYWLNSDMHVLLAQLDVRGA